MPEDKLVPTDGDETIDIGKRIDEDLYAAADLVVVEKELAAFDADFFKQELERDAEGLVYRPPTITIDHQGGKFDLSGAGVDEYSPKEMKLQVIDHAPNRALWPAKQDPNNKFPLCSSFDAIHGSILVKGENVPCVKCVYGQWWKPGDLLQAVRKNGAKSPAGAVYRYLNEHLKESDGPFNSVEEVYKDNLSKGVDKNMPPACKEVRRLFAFAYDYAKKGVLNQPVVLQVPTSSISSWDKYRQDLLLRTISLEDNRKIPMLLTAVITSVSLEKVPLGNKVYSKLDFTFDRVAAVTMIKRCLQIREEKAEQVMKFQMTLADFDLSEAIDPTSLADIQIEEEAELGETMVLDEEGDLVDDITSKDIEK